MTLPTRVEIPPRVHSCEDEEQPLPLPHDPHLCSTPRPATELPSLGNKKQGIHTAHTHSDADCYAELCGLMTDNSPDIIDPNSEEKKRSPCRVKFKLVAYCDTLDGGRRIKKEKRLFCSFCSWDSKTRIKLRLRGKKGDILFLFVFCGYVLKRI